VADLSDQHFDNIFQEQDTDGFSNIILHAGHVDPDALHHSKSIFNRLIYGDIDHGSYAVNRDGCGVSVIWNGHEIFDVQVANHGVIRCVSDQDAREASSTNCLIKLFWCTGG